MPESWIAVRIGDIFNHNTGKALNSSNKEGLLKEYITTSNLYWDRFELNVLKQMYYKESEIEKYSAIKGDLLVCEGGDIGRAAIWNYDHSICIQNHIHKLRPKTDLSVKFYFYIFMLYKMRDMIGGKGIAIQGLSSNELHNLIVPLPPLNEQIRIVEKIQCLFATLDSISQSLTD